MIFPNTTRCRSCLAPGTKDVFTSDVFIVFDGENFISDEHIVRSDLHIGLVLLETGANI